MASVTVFVDDVVRGTLPGVCARDGVSTVDSLRRYEQVGNRAGLGVAWLLWFAGPIGWFALLLISLSKSGRVEQLEVQLPMSEAAYRRMRTARRTRDRSVMALLIAIVAGIGLLASGSTPLTQAALLVAAGVIVVSLVTTITGSIRYERDTVGVTLDASRRWVSLSNVHPQFAAACQAHQAAQPHRV